MKTTQQGSEGESTLFTPNLPDDPDSNFRVANWLNPGLVWLAKVENSGNRGKRIGHTFPRALT